MFLWIINPEKIKAKNTKKLRAEGLEILEHLPCLELTEFRSSKQVAKRCVILAALLQLYFEAPNDFIVDYLQENDLFDGLSAKEKRKLEKPYIDWSGEEKNDLIWSIEAVWALAWAGNKHHSLTFNTPVEDILASLLPDFQESEPATHFIDSFRLRPRREIFTTLDSFYRAHSFARNLSINERTSDLVDIDIIMERRKALEWLSNRFEDWDDIALNT